MYTVIIWTLYSALRSCRSQYYYAQTWLRYYLVRSRNNNYPKNGFIPFTALRSPLTKSRSSSAKETKVPDQFVPAMQRCETSWDQ